MIQAVRGFSCEIFQAVDRESDIWELGVMSLTEGSESSVDTTDHGDLEAVG
jgi:hypothetical protein